MSIREMALQALREQEEAEKAQRRADLLSAKARQIELCRNWFGETLGVLPDLVEPRLTMVGDCEHRSGPKHFFDCPNGCGERDWASLGESCYVEVEDLAFDWFRADSRDGARAYLYKGGDRWHDHSIARRIRGLPDLGVILRHKEKRPDA